MITRTAKENGFTLIEVILSIAMLSIVSVIVLRLFIVSHEVNEASHQIDLANLEAIKIMEDFSAYPDFTAFTHMYTWLKEEQNQWTGTQLYDGTFNPTNSGTYQMTLSFTQDAHFNYLYHMDLVVIDLEKSSELIHYVTSNYFEPTLTN